jgi:acetyl esterase/lipase
MASATRRTVARGALLGLALLIGAALIAVLATPWPSVMVIRAIFDKGAADASAALEKHLPPGVVAQTGVRYDESDAVAVLDVYRPAKLAATAPTVVWVHGGGFVSGRRGDIERYLKVLAGQGFAVVNVDYSIAPGATYPTPVRQVSRALQYVDKHADALGVNGDDIVLAGDSAGAQIAAQVANLITSPAYARETGLGAPIPPERLRGALLFCGVYDVASLAPTGAG